MNQVLSETLKIGISGYRCPQNKLLIVVSSVSDEVKGVVEAEHLFDLRLNLSQSPSIVERAQFFKHRLGRWSFDQMSSDDVSQNLALVTGQEPCEHQIKFTLSMLVIVRFYSKKDSQHILIRIINEP